MQTKISYYVYEIRRSILLFRRVCTLHVIIRFHAYTVDKINGKIVNLMSENAFYSSHIYLFIPRADIIITSNIVKNTTERSCVYNIHPISQNWFTYRYTYSNRRCAVFICDSNEDDDAQHFSHGASFTRFPLMETVELLCHYFGHLLFGNCWKSDVSGVRSCWNRKCNFRRKYYKCIGASGSKYWTKVVPVWVCNRNNETIDIDAMGNVITVGGHKLSLDKITIISFQSFIHECWT